MSVTIGTKLGSLEITALIGKGGMGEVYRARDTKLKRDVAIKILPDAFSLDTERVALFQREAEVLASLNHPHIAQIYGQAQSDGRQCLVPELVDGETIQDRLKRGPIPVEQALEYARQIAGALEAAHERGITHRDLKPANVQITPSGQAKVLDFGLAKAMVSQGGDASLSQSPTLPGTTLGGAIFGTASYMSPEQAKGRPVDVRSDIWSFGVVLYEMLSGKPAFEGDTVVEVLGGVLKGDPDWAALPAATPPIVRSLLRRCLQREPSRRMNSAGDVRIEIEEALREPAFPAVAAAPVRKSGRWLWWGASAVLLLGITVLIMLNVARFQGTFSADFPEMRLDIVTPTTTDPISFALSPDGRQIVFAASGTPDAVSRLWLRPLDKGTAQPLAGTESASYPFWSPDSRSIGFFDGSRLKRIDLVGGAPQTLSQSASRGGAWSSDGVILFAQSTAGGLFRIPASGGQPVPVTKLDKQTSHRFPQFLPGGREFLFFATGSPEIAGIYLGSLDSSETKRLTAADTAGLYVPSGWLLWVRASTLVAQRLDLAQKKMTGEPVSLADPVSSFINAGAFSATPSGLIAYRSGGAASRHQLAWFDRSGKPLGTIGAPDESNLSAPRVSPDGRRVALMRTVQGNNDIWILDTDRMTRFTFDTADDNTPVWSPDGSRIIFSSNRKGHADLYQKLSSGAGSEEPLLESTLDKYVTDWSPEGRFVTYIQSGFGGFNLGVLPMEGDRKPFIFAKTNFNQRRGAFSPDGHWLAYISNESGRSETYVRPFPGPGGQWQVSTAGGVAPRWAPNGKELYYIAPDGTLMAAPITVTGTAIEPGRPAALFHTRIFGGGTDSAGGRTQYDVARDGRFLINTIVEDAAVSPITLLQNWHPPAR